MEGEATGKGGFIANGLVRRRGVKWEFRINSEAIAGNGCTGKDVSGKWGQIGKMWGRVTCPDQASEFL